MSNLAEYMERLIGGGTGGGGVYKLLINELTNNQIEANMFNMCWGRGRHPADRADFVWSDWQYGGWIQWCMIILYMYTDNNSLVVEGGL